MGNGGGSRGHGRKARPGRAVAGCGRSATGERTCPLGSRCVGGAAEAAVAAASPRGNRGHGPWPAGLVLGHGRVTNRAYAHPCGNGNAGRVARGPGATRVD